MLIDRAVIEVNGGCNYKCEMCPQSAPGGRGKDWLKKMPLDQFIRLLDEIQPNIVNLDGSGEATLNSNLDKYIEACAERNIPSYIVSNGYKMSGQFMRRCVDAGLTSFRFSVVGYDQSSYSKWMARDAFNTILENAMAMQEYSAGRTIVASYHLILDNERIEFEVDQYKRNFIEKANTSAEIWKMHNWSGAYDARYGRNGEVSTCGRPFSPDIVIRANGKVHPCCQVLGNDDAAVLGDIYKNTIEEIYNGAEYEALRERHRSKQYPDYCKNCDFLINDPEVLVYTNNGRSIDQMTGTQFSLKDFRNNFGISSA